MDFAEKVKKLYLQGQSTYRIAIDERMSMRRVKKLLTQQGVPLRNPRQAYVLRTRRPVVPTPTEELIRRYEAGDSVWRIATDTGMDSGTVKRQLKKAGVRIRTPAESMAMRRPIPEEVQRFMQQRIQESLLARREAGLPHWNAHKKHDDATVRLNIACRLKWKLDIAQYPDTRKLIFLIHYMSSHRKKLPGGSVLPAHFIKRFYWNPEFNAVYRLWKNKPTRWNRPSLDHIIPVKRGGTWELDNLRFITWFENKVKFNRTQAEWITFRTETHLESDLFIENIMAAQA